MKEGYEKMLGGNIYKKSISDDEKLALTDKINKGTLTSHKDPSSTELVNEAQEKQFDLMGKRTDLFEKKIPEVVLRWHKTLQERSDYYKNLSISLEQETQKESDEFEMVLIRKDSVPVLRNPQLELVKVRKEMQEIAENLNSALEFFNQDERLEERAEYQKPLQKLRTIQQEVALLEEKIHLENIDEAEKTLSKLLSDASYELAQIINPSDSKLN